MITLTSIISCRFVRTKKKKKCQPMPVSFFMNAKIVKPFSNPGMATAACIAVTPLQSVPQNKPETIAESFSYHRKKIKQATAEEIISVVGKSRAQKVIDRYKIKSLSKNN